jgi:hypothetical protein
MMVIELLNVLLMYQKGHSSQWMNMDDNQKFEAVLDKVVREKKLDKNMILSKLKQSFDLPKHNNGGVSNKILKEIDNSQFNDVLLDEQILGVDDSQEDAGQEEDVDVED